MKRILFLSVFLLCLCLTSNLQAQCSVCSRGIASSLEAGEKTGRGLNSGILYLMSLPYVMVGVAGVIWWRRSKIQPKDAEETTS